ncbi:MAG: isochorismatase family cysteine hydrolase [Slackia sp.]|nr:isochorismatase family cysteine hydrolase [Slackia sp.]
MIEPGKAAVVIIDMQNGFLNERSSLCIAGAQATIPACARVLQAARKAGMTIVHAVRSYADDGSNVEPCRYDTWMRGRPLSQVCESAIGTAEPAELAPALEDLIVVKPSFSAFFGTDLHEILRERGIGTVVLLGTTTPNCIRSSCYDALSLGYNVAVIEDATSSRTQAVQESNIADMAFIGAYVLSSDEFSKSLLADMDDVAERVRRSIDANR